MTEIKWALRRALGIVGVLAFAQACSSDDDNSGPALGEGTSCTVSEEDNDDATIECPDGTSVTIANGENGDPGENGAPGENGGKLL